MISVINSPKQSQIWYSAIGGLSALFVGIGLCRFAYTPLIPELISQGWLTNSSAGYLATINFLGYLLGAFLAHRLSKYFEVLFLIKLTLFISVMSLALCAVHFGFIWFAVWRFIAGITGAFLMVLTPGVILKNIPLEYRGKVAGIIFTGNGLGVIVSGFLFPFIASLSIMAAWLTASLIALVVVSFVWPIFYESKTTTELITPVPSSFAPNKSPPYTILTLLAIAYALYGIGTVPHTLFLVEYVRHELGLSSVTSGLFWSILGFGSLVGPFGVGIIADKIGTYRTLIIAFSICCFAISIILFDRITSLYVLSSFLIGAFLPGIVTLMSARILELVGANHHPAFWGKMTFYYASSQACGAYLMSHLIQHGWGYSSCFIIAGIAFVMGLIVVSFAKQPLRKLQQNNVLTDNCT